jgi:hypothetical protein
MKRFFGVALVLGMMLLWAPSTAQAVTIGATCGTCGAHATSFDISLALVNDTTHVYTATITANYVGPTFDWTYLNALGLKIDGANVESFTSTGSDGGAAWSEILGTLNSNGCAVNPGEAFACTQLGTTGATRPGPDTWTLTIDFDSAINLSNVTGAFKARFLDANGEFVGPLLSESFTTSVTGTTSPTTPTLTTSQTGAVPEPTSLLLLGSGLVLAHQRLRKRRVKA